jgi:hypothetical protein
MHRVRAGVAVATVLLLTGCAPGGAQLPSQPSPGSPGSRPPFQTASPLPEESGSPGTGVAVPPARWSAILADLSARGVATDRVELVSARAVTWNDGSLGCPKPGSSYTQALVAGMQVVVSAEGRRYDYRFGTSDSPRLCQR